MPLLYVYQRPYGGGTRKEATENEFDQRPLTRLEKQLSSCITRALDQVFGCKTIKNCSIV
jgi:hypothetical protein